MTDRIVNQFFQQKSSVYDQKIRCSIPGYEALHAMVGDFLRVMLPESARVLAVGVGTGMELITLGQTNPGWQFTGVDTSEEMLSLCRENVSAAGLDDRVSLFHGPIQALQSAEPFDGATSILVSHFISDTDARKSYFSSIASNLREQGVLVTADLFGDRTAPAFLEFFKAWKSHYIGAGVPPEEAEADFAKNREVANFITEQAYRQMLTSGGFSEIQRFYQAFLFGGWICRKG